MIIISILTYNKLSYTKKCLESLFKYTAFPEHKIVVSDNGSTDGTIDYLRSLGQRIVLIDNKENIGFSAAHNNIISLFSKNDIILMNNDIEVFSKRQLGDSWLATLTHAVEKDGLGAVGPAIQTKRGLDVGAVLDEYAKGKSLIDDFTTEPDWITGSCIYLPRTTIDAVGLLDTKFRFYYEDVDYCLRIKKQGLKIKCIKEVVIKHNDSTSSTLAQKQKLMIESRQYFAGKWGYKC